MLKHWVQKFANAVRGIVIGIRGQSSFHVHLPAAILVLALAAWLQLDWVQVSILLVCVSVVLMAELFNSCIETLAQAITSETNAAIKDALDIASGAVLTVSLGAASVGALVFGQALLAMP